MRARANENNSARNFGGVAEIRVRARAISGDVVYECR